MTRFTVIVSIVFAAAAAAILGGAARAEAAAPLVPKHGALLGAYVNYNDASGRAGRMAEVTRLEKRMGRRLDIDHTYATWRKPFPTWYEKWDVQMGRIPFVNWKGVSSRSIASGSQDRLIRARARAVRALGAPIMIQYYGEMDRQAGSPGLFRKAWRHIHAIFDAAGATNAVWVWCPTGDGFRTGRAQRYYPGNLQVDWLCADAYNWPGKRWRSFKAGVMPFYHWALAKHPRKPLMIGEFGSRGGGSARTASWIAHVGRSLRTSLKHIKAVVYFDTVAGDSGIDWRLRGSSLRAWVKLGHSSWFSGHGALTSRRARPARHHRRAKQHRHAAPHKVRTHRRLRVTHTQIDGTDTVTLTNGVDVSYRVSRAGRVSLRVLDAAGHVVRSIKQGRHHRGQSLVASWWGWGQDGRPVQPGTYRMQLVLRRAGHVVTGRAVAVTVQAATQAGT
jgi:hypothetical protein